MAEARMDERQVLSILDQLELELTQREATFGALKHIRQVLQTYREATGKMAGLVAQKTALEKDVAALQGRVDVVTAQQQREIAKATAAHTTALAAIEDRTKAAHATIAALEQQVKDKQQFVVERSAQLDTEMKAKADTLAKLNTDLGELKRRLG